MIYNSKFSSRFHMIKSEAFDVGVHGNEDFLNSVEEEAKLSYDDLQHHSGSNIPRMECKATKTDNVGQGRESIHHAKGLVYFC